MDEAVDEVAAGELVRSVTPPRHHTDEDGRSWTTRTVQRVCNGCGRSIGDVTAEEIERSIAGLPLEDVTGECGCTEKGGDDE